MAQADKIYLNITGMHCASCVANIEKGLKQLEGVQGSQVNLATRSAEVSFDTNQVSEETIIDKIKEIGYGATPGAPDILTANIRELDGARRQLVLAVILASPLVLAAMLPMILGRPLFPDWVNGWLQAVLATAILYFPGREIMGDAFKQARHRRLNMNSLIALGTLSAFAWSIYIVLAGGGEHVHEIYFESVAMIITLILVGRYLEARARRRAGRAIEELVKLQPAQATVIINDVTVEIETSSLQPGMIVLVKPGDRIPADGKIIEGEPVIDESVLTGESVPVEKRIGGKVIGGSINGNSPFKMEATATGEDSFLAGVVRLVSEAQARKAPIQKTADRVSAVFVPIVFGLAVITGAAWFFLSPETEMAMRSAIAVLIIACPCALGLATPAAVLVGTGRGAREGIILKGGDTLETLSEVDTVVFDKTGTLTSGRLEVIQVHTLGAVSELNLVRMVGSIESQSEHPVAQAIVRYMKQRQIQPLVVRNVEARPGYGMVGECDGRKLILGSRRLLESEEVTFGPALHYGEQEMEAGRSVVFAARDGQVIGLFSLADQVRSDAREVIDKLKRRKLRLSMISGDSRATAQGVARSLALDHFEAEVLPAGKQVIVESLRRAGFKVAMVGDGINDAPALAAATVGVAIGSGTQVAIESADAVLVRPDLTGVVGLFSLATETMRIIRQNLFWAFFYNVIAIPIAAGLLYPLAGLSLSPALAALAMSLSSVFVVSNSLRLSRIPL